MCIIDTIQDKTSAKIIYLDNGDFFKLSNRAFRKYNLKPNESIDDFDDILKYYIYPAIKCKITSLLSKKDYSKDELYKKIYIYGYSNNFAKPIIEEFSSKGYIDDIEYCKNIIEYYSNKYGIYMIRQKLRERGIDSNIIDECLTQIDLRSSDAIFNYLKKYSVEDFGDYKFKQKLINRLLYRGFEIQEINFAIEDYIYQCMED